MNCKWCGQEITSRNKSMCSKSCATSFRWHGCSKAEVGPSEIKHCQSCGKLLVRRNDEHAQAWHKRQSCGKSCAAKNRSHAPIVHKVPIFNHGCVTYVPGSPEFERIAALYA